MLKLRLLCITELASHPPFDTTVELYRRLAEDATIEAYHVAPSAISDGNLIPAIPIPAFGSFEEFLKLDEHTPKLLSPEDFDLAFCRTDKPHPPHYLETLCVLSARLRFVNDPHGISALVDPAKELTAIGNYLPAWQHTRDKKLAEAFIAKHSRVVAKRANSYGGKGVFRISHCDGSWELDNLERGQEMFSTLDELLVHLFNLDSREFLFVRYLNNVTAGDKRILVTAGEIMGGYLRKASDNGWIQNITAGGHYHPAEISDKEQQIIESTVGFYHSLGITTLGYDFLQDDDQSWVLSEVNAGNIGGYGRLEELYGTQAFNSLIATLHSLARRIPPIPLASRQ